LLTGKGEDPIEIFFGELDGRQAVFYVIATEDEREWGSKPMHYNR
jgi:hypothetical protein